MFGGNDNNAQVPGNVGAPQASDSTLNGVNDLANTDASAAPAPQTYDSGDGFLPTPGDPAVASPQPAPVADDSVVAPDASGDGADSTALPASEDHGQLLDIKQQALQQLSPLVGHLEQNPEEKFRTTMMMIQASDNHELIKEAYAAAQQITDEKTRAQALLDIVNEINYFTQGKSPTA